MEEPTTYMELIELHMKYRESRKGEVMSAVLEKWNTIANIFRVALNRILNILNSNVALVKKF